MVLHFSPPSAASGHVQLPLNPPPHNLPPSFPTREQLSDKSQDCTRSFVVAGFRPPYTPFCVICRIYSELTYFPICTTDEKAGVDKRWFWVDGFDTRWIQRKLCVRCVPVSRITHCNTNYALQHYLVEHTMHSMNSVFIEFVEYSRVPLHTSERCNIILTITSNPQTLNWIHRVKMCTNWISQSSCVPVSPIPLHTSKRCNIILTPTSNS